MKIKPMLLAAVVGMASISSAQILDPDGFRFEGSDLYAKVNGSVAETELSIGFLAPGVDPASMSWRVGMVDVHDTFIRMPIDQWLSDSSPAGGILLLRFGEGQPIWGVRQLTLQAGENWFGTWGSLSVERCKLPKGATLKFPESPCGPFGIVCDADAVGEQALVVMPFEPLDSCDVLVKGGRSITAVSLPGFRSWALDDLGLINAGFQGGVNPIKSDRLWKLNPVTQKVDETYWFNSTDQTWRSTLKGYPAVVKPIFFPGDAIFISTRMSKDNWTMSVRPGSSLAGR